MAEPLKRAGLRDEVYAWLRSAITYGDLPPGTLLTLNGIAQELDVSLTPVREALANLEPSGLVVREARKGYKVAEPLNPEELDRVLDARLVIESAAAERAAVHVDEGVLEQLRACVADQERHLSVLASLDPSDGASIEATDAVRAFSTADTAFHNGILENCGNPVLVRLAETLSGQWHRVRMTREHGLTDGADALTEHRDILRALESANADAARLAMQSHINRIRVDVLRGV